MYMYIYIYIYIYIISNTMRSKFHFYNSQKCSKFLINMIQPIFFIFSVCRKRLHSVFFGAFFLNISKNHLVVIIIYKCFQKKESTRSPILCFVHLTLRY